MYQSTVSYLSVLYKMDDIEKRRFYEAFGAVLLMVFKLKGSDSNRFFTTSGTLRISVTEDLFWEQQIQ